MLANLKKFHHKLFGVLAISCVFAFLLVYLTVSWEVVVSSDFVNYFVGGEIVKENGRLLYDIATNKSFQDRLLEDFPARNINIFRATPLVAVFFLPLSYFPLVTAYKIFAVINFSVLVIFSLLITKIFKSLKKKGATFFLLSFLFFPTLQAISLGQISLILALVVFFVFKNLKDKKDFRGGALSGFLLAKVQFIFLVPFLLILSSERKKYLLGFLYSGFVILAISVFVSGPEWIIEYPKFLLATETPSFGSRLSGMWTFLATLNELGLSASFLTNGAFYFSALALYFRSYKGEKLDLFFASAVLLTLFFSMHLFSHDLVLILVPLLILLNKFLKDKQDKKYLYVFSFLYFLPLAAYTLPPGVLAMAFPLVGIYLIFSK